MPLPQAPLSRVATAVLLALSAAACGGGGDDATAAPPITAVPPLVAPPVAPGEGPEFVVMLNPGSDIAPLATALGATVLDRFGTRPIWRLRAAAGATLDATLAAWRADIRVRFAEPNDAGSIPLARDQVVWAVDQVVWAVGQGEAEAATQWAPPQLALQEAQGLASGAGVRVAVFDTGIELTHPLLAPRLARDGAGRLVGIDLVDGDDDPREDGQPGERGYGHGTHVAGIVAQAAPGASLMPVRVLDRQGRGNAWVLAEALLWALDPDGNPATDDGARVLNFSLSTPQPTRLLKAAMRLASCDEGDDEDGDEDDVNFGEPGFEADKARCDAGRGAVVLAAAGNDGGTAPQYPAAEKAYGKLAVTAVAQSKALPVFANRGDWVELAAPGDRIVSAWPGGRYATASGSSMSTPWAAGVAALLLQLNPAWKPVDVTNRLLDRSAPVCGDPELRRLHAHGAVADFVPAADC